MSAAQARLRAPQAQSLLRATDCAYVLRLLWAGCAGWVVAPLARRLTPERPLPATPFHPLDFQSRGLASRAGNCPHCRAYGPPHRNRLAPMFSLPAVAGSWAQLPARCTRGWRGFAPHRAFLPHSAAPRSWRQKTRRLPPAGLALHPPGRCPGPAGTRWCRTAAPPNKTACTPLRYGIACCFIRAPAMCCEAIDPSWSAIK